jgi:hypothetical protein
VLRITSAEVMAAIIRITITLATNAATSLALPFM